MPKHYLPAAEPSEGVKASMVAFQVNNLRTEILRDLAGHPEGSTTGDIGRRLHIDYRQAHKHVKVLASIDLVVVVEPVPGTGRHPLYTLRTDRLRALNGDFIKYLLGR